MASAPGRDKTASATILDPAWHAHAYLPDTTLVALTIGGNDAGFPSIMQSCALQGCPAEDDIDRAIDETMPKVEKTLREIHLQAPSAKIVLLGYPQLFDEDSLTCVSGAGGAGMIRINAMARTMASAH
ncbi:hypothetical protein ACWDU8_01315 [Streptomyces sp. NPDC003388]